MPRVRFTKNLLAINPSLEDVELPGRTVAELVQAMEGRFPGLTSYLVDEHGALRQHVNIFVGDRFVEDRQGLSDDVPEDATVSVMQALSGG